MIAKLNRSRLGKLSVTKGKAFERLIARMIREAFPAATVRRASQAERAHNSDVFVEGSGTWLDDAWLELTTGKVSWSTVQRKRDQAARDIAARCVDKTPVVVWRNKGEQNIFATSINDRGIMSTTRLVDELAWLKKA